VCFGTVGDGGGDDPLIIPYANEKLRPATTATTTWKREPTPRQPPPSSSLCGCIQRSQTLIFCTLEENTDLERKAFSLGPLFSFSRAVMELSSSSESSRAEGQQDGGGPVLRAARPPELEGGARETPTLTPPNRAAPARRARSSPPTYAYKEEETDELYLSAWSSGTHSTTHMRPGDWPSPKPPSPPPPRPQNNFAKLTRARGRLFCLGGLARLFCPSPLPILARSLARSLYSLASCRPVSRRGRKNRGQLSCPTSSSAETLRHTN